MKTLDNKAAFTWGVLQCHRVKDEFIKLDFQGHPGFDKEMSLFVLTERVDPSEISSLDSTISGLRTIVHDVQKSNKHLEEKYVTLKRNYDNLINDMKIQKQSGAGASKKKKKKKLDTSNDEDSE
jgi:hypothetical protein